MYTAGRGWKDFRKFAPARYRTRSRTKEPYGVWYKQSMTTFAKWSRDGYRAYDMAVITLKPRNGVSIGDRVGYAGIARASYGSSVLDTDNIKGYPFDKPNGQLWQTGACKHEKYSGSFLSKHYCDTTGGMSGSAVMSSDGFIHGIHVAGSYIDRTKNNQVKFNVAVLMHNRNFDYALKWSGRA